MSTSASQVKTIAEYISSFPKDVRNRLNKIRQTIRETAPDAVGTISYGIPTFKQKGEGLVSFAAWKNHIALYAIPSGNAAFKKEIAPYKGAKSTARFPIDKPLPLPLIRKFVKYRVKENSARKQKKKGYGD